MDLVNKLAKEVEKGDRLVTWVGHPAQEAFPNFTVDKVEYLTDAEGQEYTKLHHAYLAVTLFSQVEVTVEAKPEGFTYQEIDIDGWEMYRVAESKTFPYGFIAYVHSPAEAAYLCNILNKEMKR